mmetsp:Transcript_18776/g.53053  ORF Transcript_18776/g.53053 Transcript_18776/m.53053 type:complete len:260 (+) Transcript_18776:587-1366(+)
MGEGVISRGHGFAFAKGLSSLGSTVPALPARVETRRGVTGCRRLCRGLSQPASPPVARHAHVMLHTAARLARLGLWGAETVDPSRVGPAGLAGGWCSSEGSSRGLRLRPAPGRGLLSSLSLPRSLAPVPRALAAATRAWAAAALAGERWMRRGEEPEAVELPGEASHRISAPLIPGGREAERQGGGGAELLELAELGVRGLEEACSLAPAAMSAPACKPCAKSCKPTGCRGERSAAPKACAGTPGEDALPATLTRGAHW